MQANPTTCRVITEEPPGFWPAQQLGLWIRRGAPTVSARDVGAAEMSLAELAGFELEQGEAAYVEHKRRIHEARRARHMTHQRARNA